MTEKLRSDSPRIVEQYPDGKTLINGLDDELIRQLVQKSKQKNIRQNTPKDSSERFKNTAAVSSWLEKGRDVYALTDQDKLAGIVWYGRKHFPMLVPPGAAAKAPNHTFAVRMYWPYQGKGMAKPLMDASLKDYLMGLAVNNDETFTGLWLSTNVENEAAKKLYQDYGYTTVGFSQGEQIMVLSLSKIEERVLGA